MIPKEKNLKLISLYMYICDVYKSSLRFYCQRFSNNSNPEFTDEEVLTVYLFWVTARDTSASRRYILSPRSICHRGFPSCRLTRHSMHV